MVSIDGALTEQLKQRALELGFERAGAARAGPLTKDAKHLAAWLKAGYHGSMDYLKESAPVRADPTHPKMLTGAKSVLVLATPYRNIPEAGLSQTAGIARFARRRDYHNVLYRRLDKLVGVLRERGFRARRSVDSMPVLERAWARQAGLGFIGKNCCLIAPGLGSYLFLSAIITDAELKPDAPITRDCGRCRICLDQCPTGALVAPRLLDARRCVSYLTQKDGGELDPDPRPRMGGRLFGCDACQESCPFNRVAVSDRGVDAPPYAASDQGHADAASILQMDDAAFARFARNSPLRKAGRERLARNAAVALGNTGDRGHLPLLQKADRSDASFLVRQQATWAIRRIQERLGI